MTSGTYKSTAKRLGKSSLVVVVRASLPDGKSSPCIIHPSFRHLATGAIIRTMTGADARMTPPMLDYAFANAKRSDGLLVADAATVAAMKLIENSFQDDFDVVTLIRIGAVDLSAFRHFDIPLHRLTVLKIS